MKQLVCCIVLAALAAASAPAPGRAAQSRAFVLTSDFITGGLSTIDLATRGVTQDVAVVHSDAVARWYQGRLYVVNRYGQDNVQVIDPAAGYATVQQFSTGNGSNPQDIVFVSPTRAYVTRYELGGLLIVNPQTGATLGQIDLSPFADADGIPEMHRMIRVGTRLFVSVQRLSRPGGFVPTDTSLVVAIDTGTDTVIDADPVAPGVQGIVLPATNPATAFAWDADAGRILVGCVGSFGVLDGGVASIDPWGLESDGLLIGEASLGGDIGDLVWNGAAHSYAVVSDAGFDASLVSWSAVTGNAIGTLFSAGGFYLPDCALDDRGELYLCVNNVLAPGVRVYSTATDLLVAGPLDVGLPPQQVVFDAAEDAVLDVPEVAAGGAGARLGPPRPNPARLGVELAVEGAGPGRIEAAVFDPAGRRVRALEQAWAGGGIAHLKWDLKDGAGSRVRAGVYMIRVRAGETSLSRRVVVVD